ncbi:MAG TPA: 7TM diverse intracellular signaling domain-containing protein [Spirochaetota bacterium]|nr:7TM diverse intracellular signaling domain-containing protein [Spirochaetota bacterium]HPN81979.1 7TM diverse intracellular signaling domain-containing protein [Spirochaetota bacterium]
MRLLLTAMLLIFMPDVLPGAGEERTIHLQDPTAIISSISGNLPIRWHEDRTGRLAIHELLSNRGDALLTNQTAETPNFGFTDSVFWIRIDINSGTKASDRHWLLELGYPFLDEIQVWFTDTKGIIAQKAAGRLRPFGDREILHRNFVFRIPDFQGQLTCFLRIKSSSNLSIPLRITELEKFFAIDHRDQIVMGAFYGAILVMILYNLLLFASFRDLTYLYYVLFLGMIMLVQMGLNGVSYEYLWPDAPLWNSRSFIFFTAMSIAAISLFEAEFLSARRQHPRLWRILMVLAVSLGSFGLASFFIPYAIGVRIVSLMAVIASTIIIGSAFFALGGGSRAARFYLFAWISFLAGGTLLVVRNFGLVSHSFLTMNSMQIGITLLVVFLSLAIAERIALLRREHEHLALLEKELTIASTVQGNVLPSPRYMESIRGWTIKTAFIPMNSTVSGDYFNITHLPPDKLSLTIADASGHGMQAALTTMQIDLLCKESQLFDDPGARLAYMNRIWLEKRLSNNFFTCFTADIENGKIRYACAGHPSQYLLRPASKTIHALTAPGPLAGFNPAASYSEYEIPISQGDILLLFSDGVLEEFDPFGTEYGEDGLLSCLETILALDDGHLSPTAYIDAIIRDISRFCKGEAVNDDITILALRKS